MYKPFIILAFSLLISVKGQAAQLPWLADFEKAQKESLASQKPLFAYFTGSDWCAECAKFKEKILENESFVTAVKERFTFVTIDFPLTHTQNAELATRNKELKERYKIAGLPTIALILPSGNALLMAAPSSYAPGKLAAALLTETEAVITLEKVMTSFAPERYNSEQLVSLYHVARLIARDDWQEKILESGLKKGQTSFFLREKYRLLVQKGLKNSPEASAIREQLLKSDPQNELGHQLYVAVSDFQENIAHHETNAAEPLVTFLQHFKKPSSYWKVKAMLASYFMAASDYTSAKRYLEEALAEAPAEEQASIKELLNKLK